MNAAEFDAAFGLAVGAGALFLIFMSMQREVKDDGAGIHLQQNPGAKEPKELEHVNVAQLLNEVEEVALVPALSRVQNTDIPRTIKSPIAQVTTEAKAPIILTQHLG